MAALCFTGGDILQAQKKEPFLAFGDPSFKHNFDLCLISAFLLAAAFFQNGVPALLQAAVCVSVCCLCEYFSFRFILGVQKPLSDLSAVKTGLLIALLLPASAPLYIGASAACFASPPLSLPLPPALPRWSASFRSARKKTRLLFPVRPPSALLRCAFRSMFLHIRHRQSSFPRLFFRTRKALLKAQVCLIC